MLPESNCNPSKCNSLMQNETFFPWRRRSKKSFWTEKCTLQGDLLQEFAQRACFFCAFCVYLRLCGAFLEGAYCAFFSLVISRCPPSNNKHPHIPPSIRVSVAPSKDPLSGKVKSKIFFRKWCSLHLKGWDPNSFPSGQPTHPKKITVPPNRHPWTKQHWPGLANGPQQPVVQTKSPAWKFTSEICHPAPSIHLRWVHTS